MWGHDRRRPRTRWRRWRSQEVGTAPVSVRQGRWCFNAGLLLTRSNPVLVGSWDGMNGFFDADSVSCPDGADYSPPRCRPLPETANRLDWDSFSCCLLMLFLSFWLVWVFRIGVGGEEKRELKEMERNARLSPATWNERGEAVACLGTRKGKNGPGPFPLSQSSSLLRQPFHLGSFDGPKIPCRWRPRRRNTADDALLPDGDDRSHTTRAPPLRLCRRRSRSASPTRPPSSQKACSVNVASSPLVAFPLSYRLLTLHSIGAP